MHVVALRGVARDASNFTTWHHAFGGITDIQRGETHPSHGIYRRPDPAPEAALGRRQVRRLQAPRRLEDHLSGGSWIAVPRSPPVAAVAPAESSCRLGLAGGGSRALRFQGRNDHNARSRERDSRARLPVTD